MNDNLVARDLNTGELVKIGDIVTSFRGEQAELCYLDRVNEFFYGGRRSGKVGVRWLGRNDEHKCEYYDNVFNLIVEYKEGSDGTD